MPQRVTLGLLILLSAIPPAALGNGDGTGPAPPTVFERFVLSACSPCVRESFSIATVPVAPFAPPGLPRGAAAGGARSGEITIEVLRARQPSRPDWRSLALRVTLSVATGTGGDLFRLGTGLLDGAEVKALAQAVGEMARAGTTAASEPRPDSVDTEYHGGTVRIGVLQLHGDTVGYIQTGDLPTLLQRAVWEVPTTLYIPVKDLADVASALGQAATRIDQVGSN